ncbi:MAG TPA: glycerol-3-phosphate 1-O-acyltransferase PlsB [Rhodanobacteraceae bacterium]
MASTHIHSMPATGSGARPHWWQSLAGRLLRPWVRIKRDPAEPATLLDPDQPVCYVVERHGLSDTLILERACREAGLPSPFAAIDGLGHPRHAMFSLTGRMGGLFGRTRRGASQARLRQLLAALEAMPERDVQLVPVAIYVGRAPGRESGWFRVLFSEEWVVVGRFRRLLALLLNGRDTVVHFSRPVSMRAVLAEADGARTERTARMLARVLRTHFRRIRAAVIGPDLSHRRTVVDSVLNAAPVREAIGAVASKDNIPRAKAVRRAHAMMMEIAADYSHTVVRSASFILSWFWNKLYDGISMHHFDAARDAAPGHEVIYVPCHRSHADYVLLSYQLQAAGVVVPHIGAGINLNLPVLGRFLRAGGAFFMRRSFKGSALYSTIFKEYMAQLIDRGVPLEYFIEGGRSRTGRLLKPHAGMLSMTVRAFLRAPRRPVLFQPVYIGYEKLMEGKSYIGELSGQTKEKESWLVLLRGVRKVLKQHYGHVAISFGEPVELNDVLDACAADWREHADLAPEAKPEWLGQTIDKLSERILVNINASANVNPVNLLALVILATRKHAVAESDLLAQLDLLKALMTELPYAERVTVTTATPAEIIAHGEAMGWISRVRHPQGDVLVTEGEQAVLLSYFRNNVLHLVAAAAWVASCFLNNRRMSRASILRLGRIIYPFIRGELFLRWSEAEFVQVLSDTLDFFVRRGLLDARGGGRLFERGPGQGDGAFQLKTVARTLMQAFERYYIAIATLVGHGPGALSAGELESACTLTAQRVALLHELSAPEFFDKALFRGFIQRLRERKVIWGNASGKLDYDPALAGVVEDARVILSRELRHSVLKMTAGEPKAA